MNKDERFKFYENLYFREIDRIEKVSARLSLPFAALLAVSTILAFMINAKLKPSIEPWQQLFWAFFVLSVFALLIGAWFLRTAWFGHFDKLLPSANSIESYRDELEKTYEEYDNSQELVETSFKDFLFKYYIQFASENAINNDRRSYNIYRALVSFTISILLALLAAIPFYLGSTPLKELVNVEQNATTATSTTTAEKRKREHPKASEPPTISTSSNDSATKTKGLIPNKQIQPTAKSGG